MIFDEEGMDSMLARCSREGLINICKSQEWQLKEQMGRIDPLLQVIKERDAIIEHLRGMVRDLEKGRSVGRATPARVIKHSARVPVDREAIRDRNRQAWAQRDWEDELLAGGPPRMTGQYLTRKQRRKIKQGR